MVLESTVFQQEKFQLLLKADLDPKKIYFHGNNKLPSEIEYALETGRKFNYR